MQEKISADIISLLSRLVGILKDKENSDVFEIKELSNHVIHNASIFQDEDSISVAILVYSLSKIIERKGKKIDYGIIIRKISACIESLKVNDDMDFRKSLQDMFNFIRKIDEKLNLYIHEIINHARIKKGCKLCEHGISIARSSEVLGLSQWELMQYLGKTTISDKSQEPISAIKRLKVARGLF